MCYMAPASRHPHTATEQVGVRELRQNLSVYLRRIAAGEEFTVTERGRPVARLSALPAETSLLDRLVAAGAVTPPARPGPIDVAQLSPPIAVAEGTPTSQAILDQLREDRV